MAGEFDLIAKYFKPLAGPEGLGLADDTACLAGLYNHDLIVTKDILVENVHFRSDDPVELIAHKALAVNISDCIAKGAKPKLYWLGLALPASKGEDWVRRFCDGLKDAQEAFGCVLAGGDTTRTVGPVVLSITLLGTVPNGQMIKRVGAKVNDDIYITGTLGDAALGLWCLENGKNEEKQLISAYQKPMPPFMFGQKLAGIANGSADVSDGLIADIGHIAASSGAGMRIEKEKLPLSKHADRLLQSVPDLWPKIWSGGDDYQIVFTASRKYRAKIKTLAIETRTQVTKIGEASTTPGVQLLDKDGKIVQVAAGGYTHF